MRTATNSPGIAPLNALFEYNIVACPDQLVQKEIMDETLLRWLQNIMRLQNSFIVTINNFSSIPPDTIYLRIQEAENFNHICRSIKMIDGFVQANDCPPVQMMTRPLIKIASGLPENIYNKVLGEYAERSFTASFKIEKFSVLKRETIYDPFQLLYSFNLSTPLN